MSSATLVEGAVSATKKLMKSVPTLLQLSSDVSVNEVPLVFLTCSVIFIILVICGVKEMKNRRRRYDLYNLPVFMMNKGAELASGHHLAIGANNQGEGPSTTPSTAPPLIDFQKD